MADLHKAVAGVADKLGPDDAELAAGDLTMLTEEAVSPQPRLAQWRRAADGLLDTAKRIGEAANPVIELVTKVGALLNLA